MQYSFARLDYCGIVLGPRRRNSSGGVFVDETGLYYLQSRYYNPKTGRFLNADAYASTGVDILGTNAFAYCSNNPSCNVDSSGKIPRSITGADFTDSESWRMRQVARRLVRKTTLNQKYPVESGGNKYKTYNASIDADEFKPWFKHINTLENITKLYADELHKRIEKRKKADADNAYWTMSKNHIQSETMAHLFVHIVTGGRVNAAQRIDLNVDESRWYVILLMEDWGYERELDNEKNQ